MEAKFLPLVNASQFQEYLRLEDNEAAYDLLAQPLHEELYRRGSFDFFEELTSVQQMLLAFDYVRAQAGQGGFIQLIQNGYIGLLPDLVGQMKMIGADDMAQVMDDVLKVYVLNREQLGRPTDVKEFARLYDEFKEFEWIDTRYAGLVAVTMEKILKFAAKHLEQCIRLI